MLGMLETTFHGQKTFRLVGGSLSWSEKPYFHKGGQTLVDFLSVSDHFSKVIEILLSKYLFDLLNTPSS